ncbi:Integral membrane protein 2B [Toxocara canis]|uniref:Integral membrane protein 2 n=1 Tax=Toxocara canis TaxID=6265 RepID=A0A0B2VR04_TOXCA|nr:Integral membrane protein 2B [Toxocara canis]
MTVFTAKSKETPEAKKVLDSTVCLEPCTYQPDGIDTFARFRRHRAFTTCCLLLLILWLLVASFLAGIFFYRQFYKRPTFYGWCGTNFVQRGRTERLEQSLEINPDEYYERISVPRFGSNRPAIFVHDFKKNLTAIVDVLTNRCFLKDLDRNLVAPPTSLIDLVEKMESGYYEHRPAVRRETYRVAGRLYENDVYNLHSPMISRHCGRRSVFLLQKASRTTDRPYFIRDKRRVRKGRSNSLQFSVLSGNAIEVDEILL